MLNFISVLLLLNCANAQSGPIVNTAQGLVRGLQEDGVLMYLGIRYAKVDESNQNFGSSQPPPQFDGIFDAVDDSALCPQIEEFNNSLSGSLDCLHLNIFVPETGSTTNPLPVMVWIYGGRFEFGFYGRFLYGPKYLVRHDIILITLNYRVGPYGFMCTDDSRVPGNQGLKDQLAALKWIQENIANFGGDPNRITIAGNSAGSMSTDFQILSNHEPRLFNQAILQSGTAFSPSFPFPDKQAPLKLSQYFGLNTTDVSTALDYLTTIDPLQMINASNLLEFTFRPCIEETFPGVEPFINFNWVKNGSVPLAKELNVLIGFTDAETLGLHAIYVDLITTVKDSLSSTFDVDHDDFVDEDQVRHFFYGDDALEDQMDGTVDLRSDMSFIYPSLRTIDKLLLNEVQQVYLYMFTYKGGRNFSSQRLNLTEGGAIHADDIGYLFDIEYMDEPSAEDQIIVDRMTAMWTNFVKYGDPTPEVSNLLPEKWMPITNSYHYMTIGSDLRLDTRPFNERHTFWDLFFEKNKSLQLFLMGEYRQMNKHILDGLIPY